MKILNTLRNRAKQTLWDYRRLDFGVTIGLVASATVLNLLVWPNGSD